MMKDEIGMVRICTVCGRAGEFTPGQVPCKKCRSRRETIRQMQPHVRERRLAMNRERYANDPAYRERRLAWNRAYREERARKRRVAGYTPSVLDRLKLQLSSHKSKLVRTEDPDRRARLAALAAACQAEIDRILRSEVSVGRDAVTRLGV